MENKKTFLKKIQNNIITYGHHITIVSNGICPRFAYSIGAIDKIEYEVIFAGGEFYTANEVSTIIDNIISKIRENGKWEKIKIDINSLGSFSLSKVHESWAKLMVLGAYEYYNKEDIPCLQIVPDKEHYTLEIPQMANKFNVNQNPVWQWLIDKWNYPVPSNVTVTTNLDALFGNPITEIMRWEEDEWEMFSGAGPDVRQEDIRIVPIGTILGIDSTINKSLGLEIGKGLWRDTNEMEWHNWG